MAIRTAAQARAATQANRNGRVVATATFVDMILAKVDTHVAPYTGQPRRPGMARILPYIIDPFAMVPETAVAPSEEELFYVMDELTQAGFTFGTLPTGEWYMGWL